MTEPAAKTYVIAKIDESTCIGCTKCIDACPFDAIIGAKQQLHAVIEDYCTGCKLCLPPCPVNCISLIDFPLSTASRIEQAKLAKNHYQAKAQRLKAQELAKAQSDLKATQIDFEDAIAAMIARAKQKREALSFLNMAKDHE